MKRERRREEEEKEEERYGNYVWNTMIFVWRLFVYRIVVWMAMCLYGTCMEVFVWILVVPFLGFS